MRVRSITSVANRGDDNTVHPDIGSSVDDRGIRLRLKLSAIFHHDKKESGFLRGIPFAPGRKGSSHGISCQSPLIHLDRRVTSVLYRAGYSSNSRTSLSRPERA